MAKRTSTSARESKLLELLGTDHSFAEIAKAMRISEDEVTRWVADIGCAGRAQATRLKATEELQRADARRDAMQADLNFTPMSVSRDRPTAGR